MAKKKGIKTTAKVDGGWACPICQKFFANGNFPSFRSHYSHHSPKAYRGGSKHPHTDETKQKLRDIANRKIVEGTWHNSFSRSRTHEYRGHKLYGTWEVKFAQYLDQLGCEWTRPKNTFPYEFENRQRLYTPDFYLPVYEAYVEIKGWRTPKDEAKWQSFPLPLIIISGTDLQRLGIDVEVRADWKTK